ncbi:hypothetical protein MNBD_ALPHA06-154 [hydrothermal vent metagenome]|uniref:Ancillary SecYEG translocon subunit/Cell division coordinator CpoB TPR domain-containing protein n=1 Tax=hydrothermal vent metagenome TaxID=652676 RepID=A0A3B0RGU0_9ZZZZ
MSDVFNEVDEELRKEQADKLFRKFLPLIIAVVVLIVGGVSGVQGWSWWQAKQKAEAAETYDAAKKLLDAEEYAQAKKAFLEIAQTGPKGYAGLAKMQAAIVSMKQANPAEADKLFSEAAKEFDDPLFADMATLKAVMAVADKMSLTAIDARLGPLAGAGRPFRALAREMIASKAMQDGDLERAREEYNFLSLSLDAPSGVQQRAQIALALLGPAPKPEPAPETVVVPAADPATDAPELSEPSATKEDTP